MNEQLSKEIENIRATMNLRRPDLEAFDYSFNYSTPDKFTPGWLAGFIEGDGTFQFTMGKLVTPSLEIPQKRVLRPLLHSFQSYFKGGYVSPKLDVPAFDNVMNSIRTTHRYKLRGVNLRTDNLLPIWNDYSFYSRKGKDYADWKKLIEMYQDKCHLDPQGEAEMRRIKENMNEHRPERVEWNLKH